MAYKDIDKVNGRTIRRLCSPDGKKHFGLISGIKDAEGALSEVQSHDTLTSARTYCGFKHKELPKTLPKSAHLQNQKGYDPHAARK